MECAVLEGNVVSQTGQNVGNLFLRKHLAQTNIQEVFRHIDNVSLCRIGINISVGNHFAVREDFTEQLNGQGDTLIHSLGVDALLVADGCVGFLVETLTGLPNGSCGKSSHLDDYAGGFRKDRILNAASDSGQRHRTVFVANYQIVLRQIQKCPVQQNQLFILLGVADNDVGTIHVGAVEAMGRLTNCHHDIVGDVDDGVDRTHSPIGNCSLQPCRRRFVIYVLNFDSGVSRAFVRSFHVDLIFLHTGRNIRFRKFLQRKLVNCRQLSGNTVVSP